MTALVLICGTHFLIDRYRLARYLVWFKNGYWKPWHVDGMARVTATGYRDKERGE